MKGPIYNNRNDQLMCHKCDLCKLMELKDRKYEGLGVGYMRVCSHPEVTHGLGFSYIGEYGETPDWCPYVL